MHVRVGVCLCGAKAPARVRASECELVGFARGALVREHVAAHARVRASTRRAVRIRARARVKGGEHIWSVSNTQKTTKRASVPPSVLQFVRRK
eukprot:3803234-Pleurochrysis_carterae.AAC.2